MRARSQWTLEGIILWLVAAVVATLAVCSQPPPPAPGPPAPGDDAEVELEVLE